MDQFPIRLYSEIKDAEQSQQLLVQSGIEAVVLEIGPEDLPFALCTRAEDREKARQIVGQTDFEASIKGPLCETCNERTATVHLTTIADGKTKEAHYCKSCSPIDLTEDADSQAVSTHITMFDEPEESPESD